MISLAWNMFTSHSLWRDICFYMVSRKQWETLVKTNDPGHSGKGMLRPPGPPPPRVTALTLPRCQKNKVAQNHPKHQQTVRNPYASGTVYGKGDENIK